MRHMTLPAKILKKNLQGNVRREEEDNSQYEATGAHVNSTGAPLPPPGPACPLAYLLGPRRRYVYPCVYIYIHTHTHTHTHYDICACDNIYITPTIHTIHTIWITYEVGQGTADLRIAYTPCNPCESLQYMQ